MNLEIFSLRSSEAEVESLNDSFKETIKMLAQYDHHIIYKTEVDASTSKIKKALLQSLEDSQSPDMIVIANALSTTDASSFKQLLADIITDAEKQIQQKDTSKDSKIKKKIKIQSIGDLGNGYKGYCFIYFNTKIVVLPQTNLTGETVTDLICEATLRAEEVFQDSAAEFPDGLITVESDGKKRKQSFWQSFIPQKDDNHKEKARKSAVLAAAVIFLVAGGFLINNLVIQPAQNQQIQSEIQDIFHSSDQDTSNGDSNTSKDLVKNWSALKKINTDIVGWIKMDNTVIDYPVLENKSDTSTYQYYLTHNYKKDYSIYGSVFVDYRCKESVKSKNLILHGHHMNDGSMFGNLMDFGGTEADGYVGDLNFYKSCPTITFDTPESNGVWKIISVFKTNTLNSHGTFFNYMQSSFNSEAEFMNFVYNVKVRSLFNIPVDVNENDQLLTLSTCSYEFSEFRTVVVARKVRDGENYSVDTTKASINKEAVWPQVYYNRMGGTRPTVTTFQTALKDKQINWYDGDGKLEGKETLTGSVEGSTTSNGAKAYTVIFLDYKGDPLKTEVVEEGKSATPPEETPVKPNDAYYSYTFTKWGLDYSKVVSNMKIAPEFKEHRLTQ